MRQLRPPLANPTSREVVLAEAVAIAADDAPRTAADGLVRLRNASTPPKIKKAMDSVYSHPDSNVRLTKKGAIVALEFHTTLSVPALSATALWSAVEKYLSGRRDG